MNSTIIYFVGCFVGIAVTFIITRPLKAWQDGYDTAKKSFSDWDSGFDAGWDAAFKRIEEITHIWNNREAKG